MWSNAGGQPRVFESYRAALSGLGGRVDRVRDRCRTILTGERATAGLGAGAGPVPTPAETAATAAEQPRAAFVETLRQPGDDRPLGYYETCLLFLCAYHDVGVSRASILADSVGAGRDLDIPAFVTRAERYGLGAALRPVPFERISALLLPAVMPTRDGRAVVLVDRFADGGFGVLDPDLSDRPVRHGRDEIERAYDGHLIFVVRELRAAGDGRAGGQADGRADGRADGTQHTAGWFWRPLWRNRSIYAQVMLAAVLTNFLGLSTSLFIMIVYDKVIPNQAMESLVALTVGVAIALGFDFLIKTLRATFIDKAGRRADVEMGRLIFDQLLNMQMRLRRGSSGAFASMLREFDSLRDFFTSATLVALVDMPFIVLFILVIYLICGPVALVPALIVPAVIVVGVAIQPFMARLANAGHREGLTKQGVLVETVNGLETIKVTGAGPMMRDRWQQSIDRQSEIGFRTRAFSQFALNFTVFAQQAAQVLIIVYGVFLIADARMSMGALVAAVILTGRCLAPLGQVAQTLARANQALTAYRALNTLMAEPPERDTARSYLSRPRLAGAIDFVDVAFRYPDQKTAALDGVSFTVKAGEKVAVLGRVGSGKSTVGKLLLGLYQPDAGAILVDQTDMRQIDPVDLRANIGTVLQDVWLFSGTVRSNVALGAYRPTDEDILRACEIAGVHDFVKETPNGYDLMIGERGEGLSGGQRQAVAIARALLGDPPVLVMDEPTSAMDMHSEQLLLSRLADVVRDKTLVLMTHRPALLSLVDRVIVMDHGKVVADGPKSILNRAEDGVRPAANQ